MIVAGFEFMQDDPVALLAEDLARLGAGVVELAGLADHDGAGADQQDRLDVVTPRHRRSTLTGIRRFPVGNSPDSCTTDLIWTSSSSEVVEQVAGVVGAGAGLGVVLDRPGVGVEEAHALARRRR